MSLPLLKTELKSNGKILILFFAIIAIYAGTITVMYDPKMGESLNAMAESMPELFAAFGMKNPGVTLLDFLINYLYGFLLLVIPFVYAILMCNKLMAGYIDRGSMAYLLNTRYSRTKIAVTQGFVLLLGQLLLTLSNITVILLCTGFLPDADLDMGKFLFLNFALFSLQAFFSAFCYLFVCLFNETRYSIGIGAGLGTLFVLLQMLSETTEDTEFLKYFTPLTLFDPEKIIAYDETAMVSLCVFWIAAAVLFTIGIMRFKKRDLPL